MKLLFIISIFVLIQLMPLNTGYPLSTNSSLENFLEFYETELYLIAEDFCEKAKNISENLLLDEDIKNTPTTEIKEFKLFLHEFLQDYPHFKRYKLYVPLLSILINAANTENTYHNSKKISENDLKFKQVIKQYFANILKNYEQNYEKFIKQKFIPKIEDFKRQLSPEDLEQMPKFSEIVDTLKSCQNFQCFPTYLDLVYVALNVPKYLVIEYSKMEFKKCVALLSIRMYNIGQLILKNEKLLQLSLEARQNLTHDINDFSVKFQNNNNIEKFVLLVNDNNSNFPKKYYNNTNFPSEDRVIFNEMFKKLVPPLAETKYELENFYVMTILGLKMIFIMWLEPQHTTEEIKPLLEFLNIYIYNIKV